jgi:hypothetical protein
MAIYRIISFDGKVGRARFIEANNEADAKKSFTKTFSNEVIVGEDGCIRYSEEEARVFHDQESLRRQRDFEYVERERKELKEKCEKFKQENPQFIKEMEEKGILFNP